jgi:NTP pyrophosphatase (non-canonical NTP hydrolase)
MDFDEYQNIASETDQFSKPTKTNEHILIPLLGLAGETGTMLSEFKKKLRDKEAFKGFQSRAEEELGDILWYVSNIASKLELSLSAIASKNLTKAQERWPIEAGQQNTVTFFDADYPKPEQLPRKLRVQFSQNASGHAVMTLLPSKKQLGNTLTDNAHVDDGYRFHDVFHLAYMAVLGWSPVMRKLLDCKRKSSQRIDEVEDGARAGILEEMIVAFVYSNASERSLYDGIRSLDSEMLATVKRIVAHVEVGRRRTQDWENAILQGYTAFRHLTAKGKGIVVVDMDKGKLIIEK